ncbi:hypothetical protein [Sphingomonas sp. 2SG]|uniref:hypothetical protein n=1 Tax=Sphingomonas sp. 2SG TaxID=2502201 RepID=UPI0010F43E6E|nr:hypothetical protein [Sphingomonas sp. 2SG]
MEYWIVYDLVSGIERYRGAGSVGTAELQSLPEGLGIALVPAAAVQQADVDLDVIRAAVVGQIDMQAEQARQVFLTSGAGQALTYQRKEAEARAWVADHAAAVPFLAAEAATRAVPIAELAAAVIKRADTWTAAAAAIEALRIGAKAAVANAATLGAIVSASRVAWSSILSPSADRGDA